MSIFMWIFFRTKKGRVPTESERMGPLFLLAAVAKTEKSAVTGEVTHFAVLITKTIEFAFQVSVPGKPLLFLFPLFIFHAVASKNIGILTSLSTPLSPPLHVITTRLPRPSKHGCAEFAAQARLPSTHHWPLFPHALMTVLYVTVTGRMPSLRIVRSSLTAFCHWSLRSHALITVE